MQTIKLLLNAVVSENAEFCTADIGDFYLGSDLEHDEFMHLTRSQVLADIQARYLSNIIWLDDKTLVRISKGIYGLPQAARQSRQPGTGTAPACSRLSPNANAPFIQTFYLKHIFALVIYVEHLFSVIRKE